MDTVTTFHSTWFDAVLLGVITLSIIVSFFRGFLSEVISFCSWVLAFFIALKVSSMLAHGVFSWIQSAVGAYVLSFVTIVALVLLVGWVTTKLLKGIATLTGLGIFDRALGVVFGFFRGVLVTTLMVMLVSVTTFARTEWFTDSAMKVALKKPEQWIQRFIPDDVVDVSQWADHRNRTLDDRPLNHRLITEPTESA